MEKKVIALLLALSVTAAAMTGCGQDNKETESQEVSSVQTEKEIKNTNTQKQNIFELESGKYYCSGSALFDITNSDAPALLQVKEAQTSDDDLTETGEPKSFSPDMDKTVRMENVLIGSAPEQPYIFKWTLNGVNENTCEILYDQGAWTQTIREQLKNNKTFGENDYEVLSDAMMRNACNCTDGGDGYIYFTYKPSAQDFLNHTALAFNVCRYPVEGGKMEFLPDTVKASTFVIDEGYIYFFDCGFIPSRNKSFTVNEKRIGIYRAGLDGSEKTKLVSDIIIPEQHKGSTQTAINRLCGRLEIVGNDLYYIAMAASGDTYLYKVSLDGGTPVQVTDKNCADYYIDKENGIIYFQEGAYYYPSADGCIVYSMPLTGGEATALYCKTDAPTCGEWAAADGDYLYIVNKSKFVRWQTEDTVTNELSGQRFNLNTGMMENLICRLKSETETDLRWVKDEAEPDEDGIRTYL